VQVAMLACVPQETAPHTGTLAGDFL